MRPIATLKLLFFTLQHEIIQNDLKFTTKSETIGSLRIAQAKM
jgi:hypothetical protein